MATSDIYERRFDEEVPSDTTCDCPECGGQVRTNSVETTCEDCGLCWDQYQLQDYVDVGALEQLVSSTDSDVEVRVTVEGVSLSVSKDGVYVLSIR